MSIGEQVRLKRVAAGMTQHQLAHAAGLSRVTLSYIETGATISPRAVTLRVIATALGCPVDDLYEKAPAAPSPAPRLRIPLPGSAELRQRRDQAPRARAGVYFLYRGEECIYVGQSADIDARLIRHRTNGVDFDKYSAIELEGDQLARMAIERGYIQSLQPALNQIESSKPARSERPPEDRQGGRRA